MGSQMKINSHLDPAEVLGVHDSWAKPSLGAVRLCIYKVILGYAGCNIPQNLKF